MCCFDDLHPYVLCLTSHEREALREKMSSIAAGVLDSVSTSINMYRHLADTSFAGRQKSSASHHCCQDSSILNYILDRRV